MDLYILNTDLEPVSIVDYAQSIIWTRRYAKVGDCEVYVSATEDTLKVMQRGNYIARRDDDMVCRIESVELDTSREEGDYLIVKGYDCKNILNQRVIWNQINFNGTVENFIRRMINDNLVDPAMPERRVGNFVLGDVQGFTERTREQVTYDNLGEKVESLCLTHGYGSKVTLDSDSKVFRFDLYKGVDRSYGQAVNDFVVFSPEFDNIVSTSFLMDSTDMCNVALVAGEGEGTQRKRHTIGTASGLDRCELYVDASDISSTTLEGETIDYDEALRNRGIEHLAEHTIKTSFDGEVEPNQSYIYGTDYKLGDIVQVMNEYGMGASARITEVIECDDDNGYSIIPTFEYQEVM